ncbi:TMEM165/GDT1 family protein [Noviherbaspirillum sp.]|uniref:TMEM165/GDT1 family protein n=1 Tax=Noviherbaspirillum sp. TaxID=1926288 RepID=UPI002FE00EA8
MEAFLVSTFAVAVAEIGDKTQLLALILAARYKRPIPIIFGILVATLLNHALAGLLGEWIRTVIDPDMLRWILGASFLLIAVWALIPDNMEETGQAQGRYGVFFVTCIAFFIAEIGDKTQIATVALAAKYSSFLLVVAGTTIGMMIANVPAVILGKIASPNFPFKLVRTISAGIFAVLGIAVLLSGG